MNMNTFQVSTCWKLLQFDGSRVDYVKPAGGLCTVPGSWKSSELNKEASLTSIGLKSGP